MKTIYLPLALILLFVPLSARAEDPKPPQAVHRLEYVNYHPETNTIEWGVSEGTVSESGDYTPRDNSIATYSINLETGAMSHEGVEVPLNDEDAYSTAVVLEALSHLIADRTDNWNATQSPRNGSSPDHSGDNSGRPAKTSPQPVHPGDSSGARAAKKPTERVAIRPAALALAGRA